MYYNVYLIFNFNFFFFKKPTVFALSSLFNTKKLKLFVNYVN
jgi:hypothetical protein